MKFKDIVQRIKLSSGYEFLYRVFNFVGSHKAASTALAVAFALTSLMFSYFVFEYEPAGQKESAYSELTADESDGYFDSKVVVCVAGEVKYPGTYTLDEGERVSDAVESAGGLTQNASKSGINFAQKLTDEQYIYIPSISEMQARAVSSAGKSPENGENESFQGIVNLNYATKEELKQLDGIGDTAAQRIIEYREQGNRFNDKRDVMNIKGIGEGIFRKIKDHITV